MKPVAIFLIIALLIALIGTGYLYTNCKISATEILLTTSDAASQERFFSQLKQQVADDSVEGVLFDQSLTENVDDYQFLTYSVHLLNQCYIPADMIEFQVTPAAGDILQIGDTANHTLAARSEDTFSVTILTRKDVDAVREINCSYYLWGIPFYQKMHYSSY